MRFNRLENLIGHDKLELIKDKKIVVFGLGGVGSFAAEALVRSGVGHLVLVDYDQVDISNINRQLIALETTLGKEKTLAFAERARQINPDIQLEIINQSVDHTNAGQILGHDIDFALDCIDDVEGKIAIIQVCQKREIPMILSMGFANKFHPEMIQIAMLKNTSVCPLAKAMRKKVRDYGLSLNIPCVYSLEKPQPVLDKSILGSTAFCPSSAGLVMASYVINYIIGKEEKS
jgi:tRNA A37 threonylcarbamoyladenosine dehydratase